MNKPWLGYLSSFFFFLAGVFLFVAGRPWLGVLFVLLAIAGIVIRLYIGRNGKSKE